MSVGDPLRPHDYAGAPAGGDAPEPAGLGLSGWARWAWRQVTSMRTALILLLMLAIAAVPGSVFPQRMANPNGVTQWQADNPDLFPVLDALQLFDVYQSVWFSAIYLLLFISLIGCIIPRMRHHIRALRGRPPRTPARLSRLADFRTADVRGAGVGDAIAVAETQLRAAGYRTERYDTDAARSVSAERGYLKETANLVFHIALVGILVTVGFGSGFAYTGQKAVVEGETFVNSLVDYNAMNRGRFVAESALAPYSMRLESFDVSYVDLGQPGAGQAGDFRANLTVTHVDGAISEEHVRVNHPLSLAGDSIYLLGNGYAPTLAVRNADGEVVYRADVPFLPQDAAMTSLGVVKVADGLPDQLGLVGFFYPSQVALGTGAFASGFGDLLNPVLSVDVYTGDLGIDDGTPRSVYVLDTTDMERKTGGDTGVSSLELAPGETAALPDGLGSVTFEDASTARPGGGPVKRFVSLQVSHNPTAIPVLLFAVTGTAALLAALFVPRRRMWVRASVHGDGLLLEYAALARGEDQALDGAVQRLHDRHLAVIRPGNPEL